MWWQPSTPGTLITTCSMSASDITMRSLRMLVVAVAIW